MAIILQARQSISVAAWIEIVEINLIVGLENHLWLGGLFSMAGYVSKQSRYFVNSRVFGTDLHCLAEIRREGVTE